MLILLAGLKPCSTRTGRARAVSQEQVLTHSFRRFLAAWGNQGLCLYWVVWGCRLEQCTAGLVPRSAQLRAYMLSTLFASSDPLLSEPSSLSQCTGCAPLIGCCCLPGRCCKCLASRHKSSQAMTLLSLWMRLLGRRDLPAAHQSPASKPPAGMACANCSRRTFSLARTQLWELTPSNMVTCPRRTAALARAHTAGGLTPSRGAGPRCCGAPSRRRCCT